MAPEPTYAVKKGDILTKFGAYDVDAAYKEAVGRAGKLSGEAFLAEAVQQMEAQTDAALRLKVVRPGGGIVPMVVTTIYMILLSIGIAAPIGILAAVYLIEYAKPGKLLTMIHFAIENLAGSRPSYMACLVPCSSCRLCVYSIPSWPVP